MPARWFWWWSFLWARMAAELARLPSTLWPALARALRMRAKDAPCSVVTSERAGSSAEARCSLAMTGLTAGRALSRGKGASRSASLKPRRAMPVSNLRHTGRERPHWEARRPASSQLGRSRPVGQDVLVEQGVVLLGGSRGPSRETMRPVQPEPQLDALLHRAHGKGLGPRPGPGPGPPAPGRGRRRRP